MELIFAQRYDKIFSRWEVMGESENENLWNTRPRISEPTLCRSARWGENGIHQTCYGTPDYFVSTRSELGKTVVGSPLILLVEAKKNDFEQGWGQCLAELVAAQKINDNAAFPVFGIVTDGTLWQFGRLIGDTFTQNRTDFALANLSTLFGAVNSVFEAANIVDSELWLIGFNDLHD